MGEAKLPYSSQSLEIRMFDQIVDEIGGNTYETVNRIVNDLPLVD